MRLEAMRRFERQLGQGVSSSSAFCWAAISRLRTHNAAESSVSTAWAGVEPQQFQSGISTSLMSRALHTAWVDIS